MPDSRAQCCCTNSAGLSGVSLETFTVDPGAAYSHVQSATVEIREEGTSMNRSCMVSVKGVGVRKQEATKSRRPAQGPADHRCIPSSWQAAASLSHLSGALPGACGTPHGLGFRV